MNSPDHRCFVLAGMPRTATTFLYQRFQEHPAIFCPYRKESYYFSVNYHKGPDWYGDLFSDIGDEQIGADVTPAYFLDESAISRILEHDAQMPVVLGVRQPSDWALSWYTQVLSNHIGELPSFASRSKVGRKVAKKRRRLAPRARNWDLENSRIPEIQDMRSKCRAECDGNVT